MLVPLSRREIYGSTNRFRPVARSRKRGSSGKKYIHSTDSIPATTIIVTRSTVAVKTTDTQR
jgi:hypothetical protein